MRVVGNCSWKNREPENFDVEKFEVGKFSFKLERTVRSSKASMEVPWY